MKDRFWFVGLLANWVLFTDRRLADIPPPKPKGVKDQILDYGPFISVVFALAALFSIVAWVVIKRSKRVSK